MARIFFKDSNCTCEALESIKTSTSPLLTRSPSLTLTSCTTPFTGACTSCTLPWGLSCPWAPTTCSILANADQIKAAVVTLINVQIIVRDQMGDCFRITDCSGGLKVGKEGVILLFFVVVATFLPAWVSSSLLPLPLPF